MMKVLSVPARLRLGSSLLFLVIPLAALQLAVAERAPWWRLPMSGMGMAAAGAAFLSLPIFLWILDGKKWSCTLASVLGVLWTLLSAWTAIRLSHPALGFFTICLMVYLMLVLGWIRLEMGRSYFDPQVDWYHGLPKPIPGLECRLLGKSCRVSRLDTEGAFIFCEYTSQGLDQLPGNELSAPAEMVFIFEGREVRCMGMAMRLLHDSSGAGFRFFGLKPDEKKELGDFVEKLRGQGYVD